jgi:hypothetical protein
MGKGGRTVIVASTLLAGACKDPPQAPPPPPTEVVKAPADDATALWRDPVTTERFARRVLYTWTTAEQIAELRTTKRLLSREESPAHGASYYEQYLHGLATRGDAIAKLLDTTTFAKSRFAWPAPWATSQGMGDEQWGDQLIRVTLKQDAIVLAVSSRAGTFTARDLDNRVIPLDVVTQHPERIGAVYFETDRYREMILCNESMIASWSVGTQNITDELEAEARAIVALAAELRAHPVTPELQRGFASAVAVQNTALEPKALDELAKRLRGMPRPAALEGASTVVFPGAGTARTLRVVPKPRGTYSSFSRGTY